MKYLITDTEDYTMGEVYIYFKQELKQTNLKYEDILVDAKLKVKLAMMEIQRIFTENGFEDFSTNMGCIDLQHTGNLIEFSDNEIECRFIDVFKDLLTVLKEEE
jgi:hypothetical protein|tara:strand:+ start:156 stop:467 length:312 start_codon:yes stop_codon:yes gene_type:complete